MSNTSEKSHHRLIQKASYILIASILLSRLLGFVREWLIAHFIGASSETDVYYASFTLPDFINHLMASGALSISFVPLLSEIIFKNKNKEQAEKLFHFLTTYFGLLVCLFIVIAALFSDKLALIIAPGFNSEQLKLLSEIICIILPAQLFFYWGALAIAVQYTYGKFLIPALAPLIYNIGIITFGYFFHQQWGVKSFSIGVLIGCIFSHGILQIIGLRKLGFRIRISFESSAEIFHYVKRYLWLTLPIAIGFSLIVADEWIGKYYASLLETNAVTWLSYARTEMRIPVAVIGQAAGLASFPFLTKLWNESRHQEFFHTLLREVLKVLTASTLATLYLYFYAEEITYAIFGSSQLTTNDLFQTAEALRFYSFGILFWTAQMILSRGFYAQQKTWLPSLMGTVISMGLFFGIPHLIPHFEFVGLPIASSMGMGIFCVILVCLLFPQGLKTLSQEVLKNYGIYCVLWTFTLMACLLVLQGLKTNITFDNTQFSGILQAGLSFFILSGIGITAIKTLKKFTDQKSLF